MDMQTAVKTVLSKYATFSGRARRSELWYFLLFTFIVSFVASIIDIVLLKGTPVLASVVTLAFLLPSIAVSIRRLHDLNKSGWWYLVALIPLAGLILLFWFIGEGTQGPNQYGEDPKLSEKYASA